MVIDNIRANGIIIEFDEQIGQITIDFHGKKMAVLTVDELETLKARVAELENGKVVAA